MKKLLSLASILLVFCVLNSSLIVYANNANTSSVTSQQYVDNDIYDMINAYANGTYDEIYGVSNNTPSVFNTTSNNTDSDVVMRYNVQQISDNQDTKVFQATQLAFYDYSLESESQGQDQGVVVFCRVKYEVSSFSTSDEQKRLISVKGGLVNDSTKYWCEGIKFSYKQCGDAITTSGTKVGYKGSERDFPSSYDMLSPEANKTYSISASSSYFYNTNVSGTVLVGSVRATIMLKHGTSYKNDIDIPCIIAFN